MLVRLLPSTSVDRSRLSGIHVVVRIWRDHRLPIRRDHRPWCFLQMRVHEVVAVEALLLRRVIVGMPTCDDGPLGIRFRIWRLVAEVVEEVECPYWNYFQLRNPLLVEVETLLMAEEGDHPSSGPRMLCRP